MPDAHSHFLPVAPTLVFNDAEEEILQFWERQGVFARTLEKPGTPYSFYDGPPFATGLPHYGHIVAGIIKDVIPRYFTMKGYRVARRFGWDCHGLPIEHEINQALGLHSRQAILDYGVGRYNDACRAIVQRYAAQWKSTVARTGRWVDMDQAYFTLSPDFMQSVWWVFHSLWQKGLIYEGLKVVPYSTGISTPLSNFEANLNYRETQDPAITVSFPVRGHPNLHLLAWTTTPWTLPSHVALGVHPKWEYVRVATAEHSYILARNRVTSYFPDDPAVSPIALAELLELRYEPPFPYFADTPGAFRVIAADFVTEDSGTGIVHLAPAFGEDDLAAAQAHGLPLIHPVDEDGCFNSELAPYAGRKVKSCDADLIAALKASGRLFRHDTISHSYPFCWRTDEPLIYRAISSWFVAVEKFKERLVQNNRTTQWQPPALRDGRFGKWLENARDWAISRNRFWGTPIPIWRNAEGETRCFASKAELEAAAGVTLSDLHLEHIDHLTIASTQGGSPLRRVGGVLDCWFESGAMPYAQWSYPLQNQEEFTRHFPADFVAEGLDQTRGWFYTLLVIGTALFDRAPFRHVIVNGLVLAQDGKKMSKRLKNYPDPVQVLQTTGADALRLYLLDSPVVMAQELKFSEAGVREVARKTLLRLWNAYAFFVGYANLDAFCPETPLATSPNPLDRWILRRLQTLTQTLRTELDHYRLQHCASQILAFVEDLTNTYIRLNRRHFWQEGMPADKKAAFQCLYEVLLGLSHLMAPFTPFIAETFYQNLSRPLRDQRPEDWPSSIHLRPYPAASTLEPSLMEADSAPETLDAHVGLIGELLSLARCAREKLGVRTKIPLLHATVIHPQADSLRALQALEPYFADELNIRQLHYESQEDAFVILQAKANFRALGPRVGPAMKSVAAQIAQFTPAQIRRVEEGIPLELATPQGPLVLTSADLEIRRIARPDQPDLFTQGGLGLILDPRVHPEQRCEGLAREVIRKIQAARKGAQLHLADRISVVYSASPSLAEAITQHHSRICRETLSMHLQACLPEHPDWRLASFTQEVRIDEEELRVGLRVLEQAAAH